MKPYAAILTCNLAGVRRGSVVMDPCAGAGSLPAAAALCGAQHTLSCDLEPMDSVSGDSCVQSIHHPALRRRGMVDAIICDTPYGCRTAIRDDSQLKTHSDGGSQPFPVHRINVSPDVREPSSATDKAHEQLVDQGVSDGCTPSPSNVELNDALLPEWWRFMGSLLSLSSCCLAPGGALVAWMPHPGQRLLQDFEDRLSCMGCMHDLKLQYVVPEHREGGVQRTIAAFHKCKPLQPVSVEPRSGHTATRPAQPSGVTAGLTRRQGQQHGASLHRPPVGYPDAHAGTQSCIIKDTTTERRSSCKARKKSLGKQNIAHQKPHVIGRQQPADVEPPSDSTITYHRHQHYGISRKALSGGQLGVWPTRQPQLHV